MGHRGVLGGALACAVVGAACAATTATSVAQEPIAAGCVGPRWEVKTLSDRLANRVSDRSQATSIGALRRLPAPRRLTAKSPRQRGPERATFRVQARLVEMELEKDGEVLLIAIDPKTKGKLAAGFPAPGCTRRASAKHRKLMREARAALIAVCGQPSPARTEIGGTATITGVGFFRPRDGTPRIAPNGFGLHPVLGFRADKCLLGAGETH